MTVTKEQLLELYNQKYGTKNGNYNKEEREPITEDQLRIAYQEKYGIALPNKKTTKVDITTPSSPIGSTSMPESSLLDKYKNYANASNGAEGYQKYLNDLKSEKQNQVPAWADAIIRGFSTSNDNPMVFAFNNAVYDYRNDKSYARPDETWDEDAKNVFGSLYMESADKAYDYAELYNSEKKRAAEAEKVKKIQESATDSLGSGVLQTAAAIATAPFSIADFLNQMALHAAGRKISDDGFITPGEYSEAVKQGIASDLNEKGGTLSEDIFLIGGKGWGDVYSLGTSVAQSLVSAHTLGEWGTLFSYFGQGATNGVKDALDRGASDEQALLYGAVLGLAEGVAEKIGVDNLFKLGGTDTLKGIIKNIAKQSGAEGLEELLTSVMTNIADNAIMQDKSNFNALVNKYMENGMSEQKAKTKAWLKSVEGIAYDALAGAASGGISGSIQTGINNVGQMISDTHIGREILDVEDSKLQLLDTAKLLGDKVVDKFINKAQSGNLSQNREARTLGAIDRNLRAQMSDMYNQANGVDSEGKYTREGKKMTKEQRESNLKAIADSELGMAYAEYDVNSTKAKEEYKNRQKGELQNTLAERQTVLPENTQKLYDEGLKTYLNGKTDTDTETKKYRLGFLTARQLGMTSKGRNITSMLSTLSAEDRNLVLSIGDVAADAFDSGVAEARADAEAARREAENKRKSSTKTSSEKNNSSTKSTSEEEDPRSKVSKWEKNFGIDKTIDESKLTAAQKKDIDRIKRLSEALPFFDFAILDGKTESGRFAKENGFYDRKSNTIGIYTTAGRLSSADAVDTAMFQAATHEVVHGIKVESPESFLELRDTVRDIMGADAYESAVSRRYEQYKADDYDFTRADAEEEVVANALEDILNSEQQMFRLASGHRNIFSRIWQGIKDFLDRVFNAIGKFHFQSGEAQLLDKLDKRYKKLEKTFIDILHSIGAETNSAEEKQLLKVQSAFETSKVENNATKNTTKNSGVKYSLSDAKSEKEKTAKGSSEAKVLRNSPVVKISISNSEAEKFNNMTDAEKSKYIYSYLVEHHLNDIFHLSDGVKAIVDKKDLDKFAHTKYIPKLSIGYNFKEVVESAMLFDKADNIEHNKFSSFKYYRTIFKIGDTTYNGVVNVGFGKFDKKYHIYDINQIEEDGSNNARPKSEEQGVGPSSNNSIPQNPDSVKREDANYLKAVESGDMETAQRMVDEAAKAAGYTVKAYHGSNSVFDVFEQSEDGALGKGIYFVESKEYAKGVAPNGIVYNVFLKINNPFEAKYPGGISQERLIAQGYDGVHHEGNGFWVAFNSSQIKSADPVTYDNNGEVIPLSERFNTEQNDIRYSKKDTSSVETRESIAEVFKSLAATEGEKKIVKDYAKSVEKMDKSFEKKKDLFLKLQELKGKTDSESKVQREKYASEIQKINDEITKADESLLKIAAAEPFRSVVRKYQTEAYNKGYGKGFDAREGYILKTVAKYSHTRYYNKKDVEAAIAKAPKVEDLTQNRRGQLADELTKKLNKAKNDGERAVITRDFIQTVQKEVLAKDKNGSLKDLSEAELSNWKKSLVDSLMDLYRKASRPGEFAGGVEAFIERQKYLLELDRTARSIREKKLGIFDNATQVGDKALAALLRDLSAFEYRKTFSESKVRDKVGRLGMWYRSVKEALFEYRNAENPGLYSEAVEDHLMRISSRSGKLSIDELKNLNNSLKYFIHFVETFDKVYKNGKLVGVREEAQTYLDSMKANEPALRSVSTKNALNALAERYYRDFGEPMVIARILDCYDPNGFFTSTIEQLRQACIASNMAQMEIRAEYAAFFENNNDFTDNVGKHDITYRGAKIPAFEAMSLFMTLKREQSYKAFLTNGFTFNERLNKKAGKGRVVKVDGLVTNVVYNQLKHSEINRKVVAEREKLYKEFTDKEKEYIRILEKGFSVCGELKAKRDIERMGYSETIEGYYYPLQRSEIAKESGSENFMDEIKLANSYSFTKHSQEGTAIALKISSADDMFNRHVRGICDYMYVSSVIDYYDRVRYANTSAKAHYTPDLIVLQDNNSPESIHSYLAQHNSKDRMAWIDKYINDIFADVKGKRTNDTTSADFNCFLGKLRSAKAVSLLAGNIKVWCTQLSSIIASCDIISPISIVKSIYLSGADVDSYCDLAALRNAENTAFLAQAVVSTKAESAKKGFDHAIDALMSPIGVVDRLVVEKIFAACQVEISNEGPEIGTEENKNRAGKLLEKVIFETQQNTFATEKSAAMRSNNELVRGFTMFTSDAMKLCGRVIESYGELGFLKSKLAHTIDPIEQSKIKSRINTVGGEAVRRTGVLLASSTYLAVVSLAFNILFGRIDLDDEEEVQDELLAFFFSIPVDMLGGLPIISDFAGYFKDGYEMESFTLSTINDLLSSVKSLQNIAVKASTGKTKNGDITRAFKNVIFGIAHLFGIPARNIWNLLRGVSQSIGGFFGADDEVMEWFDTFIG